MGKRARKTRWRALDIADDHSDSEESNTNSSAVSGRYPRSYRSSAHHSKYSYSSQSTPARRRYQYDGSTKTTRSSSTTSENKITFNEDEYTRITTPRQDVLFKKGYLNKPKSYQSQTSTGNSTISTGYSTENGTPDHQSTDLDYESQFVFPNGFVDTNGIYYVNSYEPYPLMLINPPTYYHEFSNVKSKRYSTGSLSESMSPNNEESASQDLSQSGGEASNSVSDYSSGAPVYNMVFPGYYVNGTSPLNELPNGHHNGEPVKKLKKRRERKSSKTIPGDSSENTDANYSDDDINQKRCISPTPESPAAEASPEPDASAIDQVQTPVPTSNASNDTEHESKTAANIASCDIPPTDGCADPKTETAEISADAQLARPTSPSSKQSLLKPDAEEFVPRTYQPVMPPPHIKMLPPNFLPIPLVSINDFGGPNFNHHAAFIPSGIPINFIPHHPGQKMFPPVPGFINFAPPVVHETKIEEVTDQNENQSPDDDKEKGNAATPSHTPEIDDNKPTHNKPLDIATVVSKLEEAAKQQEKAENNKENFTQTSTIENGFRKPTKYNKISPSKKTFYKYRNGMTRNGPFAPKNYDSSPSNPGTPVHYRESPERKIATPLSITEKNESTITEKPVATDEERQSILNSTPKSNTDSANTEKPQNKPKYFSKIDDNKANRNSPERFRKTWKPNGYQSPNQNQNGFASPRRQPNGPYSPHHHKYNINTNEKRGGNADLTKNYSDMLKKDQIKPINNQTANQVSTEGVKQTNPSHNNTEKANAQLAKSRPNQWISVSNRKKKKNKSFEDNGFDTDEKPDMRESISNNDGDFESYDVSQLVDVVPPSKQLTPTEEQNEKSIGDILSSIAQQESSKGQQTPTDIPEVSEIEKKIIIKIEEDKIYKEVAEQLEVVPPKDELNVNLTIPTKDESSEKQETTEETFKVKKSKKGTQKPLLKKVIITDIDLSMTVEEVKSPLQKSIKKVETERKTTPTTVETPVVNTQNSVEVPNELAESTEKKSKKKKKKTTKQITHSNPTSPTATITAPEISYDFLLESNVLDETEEKTNDEISLELDKLIQKGMYSSLQSKIKSFNTENDTDRFFMDLDSVVSPKKESIPGANGFMKTPDFNRIFQSKRQFLKPNMVSVEPDITDNSVADHEVDNKNTPFNPDAADSSAGSVLDETQQVDEVRAADTTVTETPAISEEDKDDVKQLYPITQAVKDWMSRTRETTPEIDILKSPSTIKREFGNNAHSEIGLNSLESDPDDDEITLFSTADDADRDQPDLLEYWDDLEDDIFPKHSRNHDQTDRVCCGEKQCSKCRNDNLKYGDEEIEVYESKYGENEAFLNLQKLNENEKITPRPTGALPHRAVCCTIQ
ncbi:uncharacterized protein LOC143194353 isoform X2 [Rhynchophorus ferrugineus]|uniref:uncharacterized protein LOC143194353 isoform X2 n=1 Tax=Rhynchophorus ferrugineus TaxID=354439 RepID=UPI003FCE10B1